jgi:hypothetical protein
MNTNKTTETIFIVTQTRLMEIVFDNETKNISVEITLLDVAKPYIFNLGINSVSNDYWKKLTNRLVYQFNMDEHAKRILDQNNYSYIEHAKFMLEKTFDEFVQTTFWPGYNWMATPLCKASVYLKKTDGQILCDIDINIHDISYYQSILRCERVGPEVEKITN